MDSATKTHKWLNLYWFTDRYSDGTYRAAATEGSDQIIRFTADAVTELAALDGLREAVCEHLRLPLDTVITNGRGDKIKVGGGYR